MSTTDCTHERVWILNCAHCKGTEACNTRICIECDEEVW